ncbi:hypothetical protein AVEN_263974-1 [Araneus ventricosus]|uniref:Uncharacterized protein n=1 Tax=Araneus ventricosus TaxID=182803 RepID=A0A4Y2R024_ARAVE|nr:hypothetical protein AVEN_263974-1 [Araneus ventricosus]
MSRSFKYLYKFLSGNHVLYQPMIKENPLPIKLSQIRPQESPPTLSGESVSGHESLKIIRSRGLKARRTSCSNLMAANLNNDHSVSSAISITSVSVFFLSLIR